MGVLIRPYELLEYIQLKEGEEGYLDPNTIHIIVDHHTWTRPKNFTLADLLINLTAAPLYTEEFEETSSTPTSHPLALTALTNGATVSLNGKIVPPSKYTLTTTTITVNLPVHQYDTLVITYQYSL